MQVPMPRMSSGETTQIVINGLDRLSMSIEEPALDEITGLSQGLPYITHLLALRSARRALETESLAIRPSDVEVGIKTALDQWQESIKSSYYHATKSQQPGAIYREVLLACALASNDDLDTSRRPT